MPKGDALLAKLQAADAKLEEAKKKIVATKEGGAVTGEERIREHLDTLYGVFMGWEGKPTRYQIERADALRRELTNVAKDVDAIMTAQVKPLDGDLRGRKLEPVPTEGGEQAEEDDDASTDGASVAAVSRCLLSHGAVCADAFQAASRARSAHSTQGEKD